MMKLANLTLFRANSSQSTNSSQYKKPQRARTFKYGIGAILAMLAFSSCDNKPKANKNTASSGQAAEQAEVKLPPKVGGPPLPPLDPELVTMFDELYKLKKANELSPTKQKFPAYKALALRYDENLKEERFDLETKDILKELSQNELGKSFIAFSKQGKYQKEFSKKLIEEYKSVLSQLDDFLHELDMSSDGTAKLRMDHAFISYGPVRAKVIKLFDKVAKIDKSDLVTTGKKDFSGEPELQLKPDALKKLKQRLQAARAKAAEIIFSPARYKDTGNFQRAITGVLVENMLKPLLGRYDYPIPKGFTGITSKAIRKEGNRLIDLAQSETNNTKKSLALKKVESFVKEADNAQKSATALHNLSYKVRRAIMDDPSRTDYDSFLFGKWALDTDSLSLPAYQKIVSVLLKFFNKISSSEPARIHKNFGGYLKQLGAKIKDL